MFLSHYQLREQPFGVTPDPRYTYFTSTHREALASLAYAVEVGSGFAVMVAKPGMGKTTLLFRLLDYLQDKARTVFVFHTQCNSVDLMRYILADMKIKYSGKDLVDMHALLNQALLNEARLGRSVVVAIDESQNLSQDVLETIRLLSDFETPRRKLLQIILCGQPQLGRQLAHPDLVQLRQRITVLCRLAPLSLQEVGGYIDHRLKVAGYNGSNLFTPESVQMIHKESRGIPRVINTICSGALSIGCALGRIRIDPEVIREVLADLSVDSLLEELNASEEAAPAITPDEIFPEAPSVPAYMHDAPLTQALAAALAIPTARSVKVEEKEISALTSTDVAAPRRSTPLPQPTSVTTVEPPAAQGAATSVEPPVAPVMKPISETRMQTTSEIAIPMARPKQQAKWIVEIAGKAHQVRSRAQNSAIGKALKTKGGWVVGTIILISTLLVFSLRFGTSGTKAGSRPFLIPDPSGMNSIEESAGSSGREVSALKNNRVSPADQTGPAKNSNAQPMVHVVQSNETLSGIAVEYLGHYDDKTLEEVEKQNSGLKDPDMIRVGQKVTLPADSLVNDSSEKKTSDPSEGKP